MSNTTDFEVNQRVQIRATVNGRPVIDEIPAGLLLSEYIRDHLGLTGTKISCGYQICGVCTVLIDGKPMSACCTLAAEVDGAALTTIEGLESSAAELDPVQEAFVEEGAMQCGYCTPGMVMSVKALLSRDETPDEETIREWLDGNICRCGTYGSVLDAVKRVTGMGTDQPGHEGVFWQ